jgi:thiosulfate/3-mercaptopyruvate sulfurtransferase
MKETAMADASFVHPEYLVTTDALERQLTDPELRVFDCTIHLIPNPDVGYTVKPGREDFERGHIPGAQFIDLQADLSAPHPKLRFMLPSAEAFAAAMGRFGVGENSRVVLYGTTTPQWASRIWWMLRNYGFDRAAVLDGGFQKWSREGRPVETGAARACPPATFVVRSDRKLMVGKEAVLAAIGDGAVCTINALSREQHTGTGGTVYGRVGRIAKTVNVPAAALLDPATGTYLPARELRAKFAAVGAFDKPQVITYCGGGIAASSDALVLTMLGHPDVRLYDASMSEWSNDPSLPMETG